MKVPDARAFGSVPTGPDGRVQAFRHFWRRPRPRRPTRSTQINAGCYVFRRSVLESIPAGRVVSVERETFPRLLASGARVFGHVDYSYWLDLGTPAAFVRGSADLVTGIAPTGALPGPAGSAIILPGAHVAPDSAVIGGSTLGRDVRVAGAAVVDGSVVFDGADIGVGVRITRSAVGASARIGAGTVVCDAVIGDNADVGADNELTSGVRVWPDVHIPPGSVRFSADS